MICTKHWHEHPRHCERSEAIHLWRGKKGWIASSLTLLAMTNRTFRVLFVVTMRPHSAFAGAGCRVAEFATRAASAIPAKAAIFFWGSEPGCTTPADIIRVAASSALMSTSMILLLGT